jgi:hypothetical protein
LPLPQRTPASRSSTQKASTAGLEGFLLNRSIALRSKSGGGEQFNDLQFRHSRPVSRFKKTCFLMTLTRSLAQKRCVWLLHRRHGGDPLCAKRAAKTEKGHFCPHLTENDALGFVLRPLFLRPRVRTAEDFANRANSSMRVRKRNRTNVNPFYERKPTCKTEKHLLILSKSLLQRPSVAREFPCRCRNALQRQGIRQGLQLRVRRRRS